MNIPHHKGYWLAGRNTFGELPATLREYLSHIEAMKNDLNEMLEDAREALINNVLKEVDGQEMLILTDKMASSTLEALVLYATAPQLRTFLNMFQEKFVLLATNCYSNYVIEACFRRLAILIDESLMQEASSTSAEDSSFAPLVDVFSSLFEELLTECGVLVSERYGSYLLRALFFLFVGHEIPKHYEGKRKKKKAAIDPQEEAVLNEEVAVDTSGPKNTRPSRLFRVPPMFAAMHGRLISTLIEHCSKGEATLHQLVQESSSSAVYQVLLRSLCDESTKRVSSPALTSHWFTVVGKALEVTVTKTSDEKEAEENTLLEFEKKSVRTARSLVYDVCGSHFMQAVVQTGPPSAVATIARSVFLGALDGLCVHGMANFVLQSLLRGVSDMDLLRQLLEELLPLFPAIVREGKTGVILCMTEAAVYVEKCQNRIVDNIVAEYSLPKINGCIPLFVNLTTTPGEEMSQTPHLRTPTSPIGCRLLQALLKFKSKVSGKIIDGLCELDDDYLTAMFGDAKASHILEAALSTIKPQHPLHSRLMAVLKSGLPGFATHRVGSHVLEALYRNSSLAWKEEIATALSGHADTIAKDKIGRKTLTACKVVDFASETSEWRQKELAELKKKELFDDILTFTPSADTMAKNQTDKEVSPKEKEESTVDLFEECLKTTESMKKPKDKREKAEKKKRRTDAGECAKPSESQEQPSEKKKKQKADKLKQGNNEEGGLEKLSKKEKSISKEKKEKSVSKEKKEKSVSKEKKEKAVSKEKKEKKEKKSEKKRKRSASVGEEQTEKKAKKGRK